MGFHWQLRLSRFGAEPSGLPPNGIKISTGGPSGRQADQPPNGPGAAFRAGSAGLQSLENGPKTFNLMPLGLPPEGHSPHSRKMPTDLASGNVTPRDVYFGGQELIGASVGTGKCPSLNRPTRQYEPLLATRA